MKKFVTIYFLFAALILGQQAPFSRGVNITNWFQENSPKQIQFSKYSKKDFEQLKSLGVDVIRLPINLHFMTSGSPNYKPDPIFLYFLDLVVDWAEELDMHLIIDNHTFDPATSTDVNVDKILIPVWKQMAEHFKNRSNKIYYEILNEPHGISDTRWNQIQQAVVDSIRKIDTVHTIVVGPANWNSYSNLSSMPVYKDKNLIYTFHFYDPFIFTHQGASWTDPSLVPLSGVPFPYDASRMPACPTELKSTWVNSELSTNYKTNGTVDRVQSLLNTAINFSKSRGVPIFCGEFGVYIPNSPDSDRVYWYEKVREHLQKNNVAWTIWDYRGGFGLYEKNSQELFDHDLNVPLLIALGFNVPPQSEFVAQPDTTQFYLYSDFLGEKINNASFGSGTRDFYNEQNPFKGNFDIYWTGAKRYDALSFDFVPDKDLSKLKDEDYVLDFYVKCNIPNSSFDLRFVDSKANAQDHPWRMGIKINNSKITFNGQWQNVRIPLKDMTEFGSWDNAWYEAAGLFDWTKIDKLEIVAEDSNYVASKFWFDEIKVFNPNITSVTDAKSLPTDFKLEQNYPNPFNPETKIDYNISKAGNVSLKIYDILGREIATIVNEFKQPGNYSVRLSANDFQLSSGVYFYRLTAGNFSQIKKMVYLK
jgi:endoglucanase